MHHRESTGTSRHYQTKRNEVVFLSNMLNQQAQTDRKQDSFLVQVQSHGRPANEWS